jgi:3'-5' exonuclease
MLDIKNLSKNLLFIDIETVSGVEHFSELSDNMQKLWLKKASYLQNDRDLTDADFYFDRAAIYAEYAKVIVIGMGILNWNEEGEMTFRVKTLAGDNEAELLNEFCNIIEKKYRKNLQLCAHNGKEFDYPFLCRRLIVNQIEIPSALQLSSRKPWEVPHFDTLDMWRFGDRKHYTSLELMAEIFSIPCKTELSGDLVNQTYYHEKDLQKIARYCREDVIVLAQIFLRYHNIPLIAEDNIVRVD